MSSIKVRLNIAGTSYIVSTTDPESYVQGLAERLDGDIKAVLEASPSASVTSATVLAALDYLDELQKSTGSVDNMRSQIKNYLADAARAKAEAEEVRRELRRLQNEVEALKGGKA